MSAKAIDRPKHGLRSWMGEAAIGVAVALLAWWSIDLQTLELFQRANRLENPGVTLLWLIVIGGISTSLLRGSIAASISAACVLLVGLVAGALITGPRPVIEAPGNDFTFALTKGAYNPAVPLLTGTWIALTVVRWLRRRRPEGQAGAQES